MAVKLEVLFLTLALLTLSCIVDCKQQQQQQQQQQQPKQRKYGGLPLWDGEYVPYLVSIQQSGRHTCGGSIIAPDRILTAARCLKGVKVDELSVLAGVLDLNDTSGQSSKAISYVIHEGFNSSSVSNDIAILKIHPALKFDNLRVNSIELEDDKEPLVGRNAYFSGWSLVSNHECPLRAQRFIFKIVPGYKCHNRQGWLCTDPGDDRGSGLSDYGGPLVILSDGYKQVGLLSTGSSRQYEGHMWTGFYRDWIKSNMK